MFAGTGALLSASAEPQMSAAATSTPTADAFLIELMLIGCPFETTCLPRTPGAKTMRPRPLVGTQQQPVKRDLTQTSHPRGSSHPKSAQPAPRGLVRPRAPRSCDKRGHARSAKPDSG